MAGGAAARRRAPIRAKNGLEPLDSQPFAAVVVDPGLIACRHVQHYVDRRMLINDAPTLPLPSCDNADCRCRYVKLADRRSGVDRRVPFANRQLTSFMAGRLVERQKVDRRASPPKAAPRAYFNNYD